MAPQVDILDHLFFGCMMLVGVFCLRELFSNILFLRDEIKAPKKIRISELPTKKQAFGLMGFWGAVTAFFAGSAVVLFSNPFMIIGGFAAAPTLYGWSSGLIMLVAAIACGLLTFRYYILWTHFR